MRGGDEQTGELFSYVRRVLANCLKGQMKGSTAYFLSHARSTGREGGNAYDFMLVRG